MGNDEKKMVRMVTVIAKDTEIKIKGMAALSKSSFSRLIAIAIDHEFERERPFEFDITLPPSGDYESFTYSDEGGLLLNYMSTMRGIGLDTLMLMRYDIGIPDKQIFLATVRECLDNDVLETMVPPLNKDGTAKHREGYLYYRLKGQQTPRKERNNTRKEMSEYDKYLKLKKKYEKEA